MLTLDPMPEAVRRAVQRRIAETNPAERPEGDERLSGLFLAGGPGGCSYLDAGGEAWNWSAWDESSFQAAPVFTDSANERIACLAPMSGATGFELISR